jgi:PPOX class probable F420-dependent enzyme
MKKAGSKALGLSGPFESLAKHKYCELVSFRRTGTPVSTPVWFALDGERLYFKTDDPSGKVRRIHRDPHVQVAPCSLRGRRLAPALPGTARILAPDEEGVAEHILRERYGPVRRLFGLLVEPILRRRGLRAVYLEVVPVAEPGPGAVRGTALELD